LTDPPPLEGRDDGPTDHVLPKVIELFVLNAGMDSGQPSVALVVETGPGRIVIETSLTALALAAREAVEMAEAHFGWTLSS
jgi:hypothetical protein